MMEKLKTVVLMKNLKFRININELPPPRIFSRKNQSRLTLYFFKKYFFSQCSKLFSPKFFTVSFKDKTKNISQSNAGFSLVELVVVVAIIGVLATIAVPQFNIYVVKSRRTGAKAQVSVLYTAMKGFHTMYGVYHSNFNVIGFQPEGKLDYGMGFSTSQCTSWKIPNGIAPEITGSNRNGGNPCSTYTDCSYGSSPGSKKCYIPSKGSHLIYYIGNTWANSLAFQVFMVFDDNPSPSTLHTGPKASSNNYDGWYINHNKNFSNFAKKGIFTKF